MFFAINVALITYHKLNKSAPDGDAAAFEAAEPKSLGEQVGSFFAAVKAFLAGSPEIGGFLAGIVVLRVQNAPARKAGARRRGRPGRAGAGAEAAGQPEEEQVSSCAAPRGGHAGGAD